MQKLKVLGVVGACLLGATSVAKADPTEFTGFQVGALLGMSGAHLKEGDNLYTSNNGASLGLYLGYGMVLSGFFVGVDGNYTLPFVKVGGTGAEEKYKSSVDLALRFGMDLQKVAMPYLRLGYAMNKLEDESFSGFACGIGIDTKLAPQAVLGLEAMQTLCSKKGDAEAKFSTVRLKVAFHL